MTLSLTDREVETVVEACFEYIELMGEGEDTHEYTQYILETGLGSALRKIGKGRNLGNLYSKYKTVNKYPTFEEWQANRAKEIED